MDDSTREKLKILILDDLDVVRKAVIHIILAEGFEPLEFGEGEAGQGGLDLAAAEPWDLVIVRGALEDLAELKRMHPDLPILAWEFRVKSLGSVKADTKSQPEATDNLDELVSAVGRILACVTTRDAGSGSKN